MHLYWRVEADQAVVSRSFVVSRPSFTDYSLNDTIDRCFLDPGMVLNPQINAGMQFMSTQIFCTLKDIPMNSDVELDVLDMFFNVVPLGMAIPRTYHYLALQN